MSNETILQAWTTKQTPRHQLNILTLTEVYFNFEQKIGSKENIIRILRTQMRKRGKQALRTDLAHLRHIRALCGNSLMDQVNF